jgi:hypothetical protein
MPSHSPARPWRRGTPLLFALATLALGACAEEGDKGQGDDLTDKPSAFVSAAASAGQQSSDRGELDAGNGAPEADNGGGEERTVEEGDIYRVLQGSTILNLNYYRGFQVIDFSDVANPRVISRVPVSGSPVEMYVVDNRAYVLLNNWRGYYGTRSDVRFDTREGGLVLAIDISNPEAPTITGQAFVPGYIQTSRLTRGGGAEALYVAAAEYGDFDNADGTSSWQTRTILKSFDVSGGDIAYRTQIDLGGYVAALQATTEALLVSRYSWNDSTPQSTVSVVDISDPNGTMVEGDDVQVAGQVWNKFNMDLYNGVLRVVSGRTWGGDNTNHVQTWNAADLGNLVPIDDETFGDGQQLFATLFRGNKAFFVTYLRQDPFHAFEITDEGDAIEHSEFIVSGWNNYFKPVFDDQRLIGIGQNDQGGTTMAVSLYDVTDLTNPSPLIDRDEVAADNSWSEATWDDRAFSVLEDVVSVPGPGGVTETGLVLLPYSGWDSTYSNYQSAVQIFTFSEGTLTRRGKMTLENPARRSFLAGEGTTGNLGEAELSFYNTSDPDAPSELGKVVLAPNYVDVATFGDYAVRLVDNAADYSWYSTRGVRPDARIEVVPLAGSVDTGEPVASLDVPSGATLEKVGNQLAVVSQVPLETGSWPFVYSTTITSIDMTDPANPVERGALTTDEIPASYNYYWGWGAADCFDCGGRGWGGYNATQNTHATDKALAFVRPEQVSESIGMARTCYTYASEPSSPECNEPNEDGSYAGCSWTSGGITCTSYDGQPETCTGGFYRCGYDSNEHYSCEAVDADEVTTSEPSCYASEQFRYWQQYKLHVVDFTNPDALTLAPTLELPREDEGVSTLLDGNRVLYSYRLPADVEGDSRPYVRYYFRSIDLSVPSAPALSEPINIPGEVVSVDGDDLYTRDIVWGDVIAETSLAHVQLLGGRAYLLHRYTFTDQDVSTVLSDGDGHLLVSHRDSWLSGSSDSMQELTILDGSLTPASNVSIDAWATLSGAQDGRALFQVPGGVLVMNIANAAAPYPQAYFATLGWPQSISFSDAKAMFAAGRFGIYEFDLDLFNLLPPL